MRMTTLAAVLLVAFAAAPVRAEEPAGELRCSLAGGIGFVVVGKRGTSCVYYRHDGRVEFYIGSFGRLGLDIGPADARQLAFTVVTASSAPVGALDGDFVGLGVGSSVGEGVSGDALVGGRDQSVKIYPTANTRLTGLNVNAGIGNLHLRYAGTEGRRPRYRGYDRDALD